MAMTSVRKLPSDCPPKPCSTQQRRDVFKRLHTEDLFRTVTPMIRGLGRIEGALVAIFDGERDNAFTIRDLCERIWPDLYPDRQGGQVERKHRGTVIRAARSLGSGQKSVGSPARDVAARSCSSGTTR